MRIFDNLPIKMVYASYGVAGLVGLCSILDFILGIPFNGGWMLNTMYLIASGIVGYMAYDAHQDLKST